jgi:hypothetical protein
MIQKAMLLSYISSNFVQIWCESNLPDDEAIVPKPVEGLKE